MCVTKKMSYISIHVPARGTTTTSWNPRSHSGFQSTSPRGGRLWTPFIMPLIKSISIHVPARGTTAMCPGLIIARFQFQSTSPRGGRHRKRVWVLFVKHFNPRPREGDDCWKLHKMASTWKFQSTSPRGGRQTVMFFKLSPIIFQSTSPRGGRRRTGYYESDKPHISIHVPARGTTDAGSLAQAVVAISIHVPARGTTRGRILTAARTADFNPRPREGDDWIALSMNRWYLIFQSTSPRGGRQRLNAALSGA